MKMREVMKMWRRCRKCIIRYEDDDSFDSEDADKDGMPEIEEETTDEKRLRMAKSIINEAKMLRKRKEVNDDNDDEDEMVTGYLQNSLVWISCY